MTSARTPQEISASPRYCGAWGIRPGATPGICCKCSKKTGTFIVGEAKFAEGSSTRWLGLSASSITNWNLVGCSISRSATVAPFNQGSLPQLARCRHRCRCNGSPLPQGPRPDCLLLGRETHAARTDQAGVRRLEFPERATDRPLEVNVLVVGPAKGEVGRCQVAVWDWHKAENDAARVDLQHTAEPSRCGPQIPLHVVMDAVGAAVTGKVGPGLDAGECQALRIGEPARHAHRRPSRERRV